MFIDVDRFNYRNNSIKSQDQYLRNIIVLLFMFNVNVIDFCSIFRSLNLSVYLLILQIDLI